MVFLVATTLLPAVYRSNGYARTMTAGTPHACANIANRTGLGTFLDVFKLLRAKSAWFDKMQQLLSLNFVKTLIRRCAKKIFFSLLFRM